MIGTATYKDRAESKTIMAESPHDAYLEYLKLQKINMSLALNYLHYAAENGDADAQNDVGMIHFKKENYPIAYSYYKLAANKNSLAAFFNLGIFYTHGKGIKKNYAIAEKFFHKVLTQVDDAETNYYLAYLYYDGDANLPCNKDNAEKYALKAIEKNHSNKSTAHLILARIYFENGDITKTTYHVRLAMMLKSNCSNLIAFTKSLKIDDTTQHEAYYHRTLALENALDNLFYTNHYITEFKEQQNWKYLKLFIEDVLLTHVQKRDLLKKFTLTSFFDNCKWQRLLPKDEDEIIKQQLYLYLYEISAELKNPKFIAGDMLPGKALAVIQKNSTSIFYQALEEARLSFDNILVEEKNIIETEKELLLRLSAWTRSIRDLHFFSDKKAILLKEEYSLFIDHYQMIINSKNLEISPTIFEKVTRVFEKLKRNGNALRNDYIQNLNRTLKENKIELFKHLFMLRIAAKWSAAMGIYSHDIKRYDITSERIEAGLGIVKGIISCIPIAAGISEIVHSTGKLIHSIQSVSSTFEMITEGIEAIEAIKKGVDFLHEHYFNSAEKKLFKLYANLGIHGPDYIDSFCQAICSRYEETIQLIVNDTNVGIFAEDTAKFVLDFLMSVTLTEKEKNESLAELLILWCSKNYLGKGEKIKIAKNEITSGDLLGRTSLSCGYETADEKLSISLGIPHYLGTSPTPLSPRSYGQAKATHFEVTLFQQQLISHQTNTHESKEPISTTSVITPAYMTALNCRFSTEAIHSHARRVGLFSCSLRYQPPLRLLVIKQQEEIAELKMKIRKLETLRLPEHTSAVSSHSLWSSSSLSSSSSAYSSSLKDKLTLEQF